MSGIARALVACLFALAGIAASLAAEPYPNRPLHLIVGFPAGGPTDIVARLVAQSLSVRLGQQVVIENRPGAGSNVATQVVVSAPPDGYTLLLVSPPHAINATLYKKLSYNFLTDIVPVAGLADGPNVMEVHPSVPAKTVAEFIAYAKANPGKLTFASAGNGTTIHLSGELFMALTGVKMLHVPYRGSAPALTDMMSGQVQVMFDNVLSSLPHLQSGALRPLAVTSRTRLATLPDVPTVAETVPGYETGTWWGVGVPKGTPAEIVDKLNREINAVLAEPAIKTRLSELGSAPLIVTPQAFGAFLAAETEKWAKAVRFSGASID
ncbi:MAG: tripartite tricarboxylate transporter substrate binding protein [Alphaproteobacteria bacterium]|nr:tripartite tricarboxylate transporter substrate binding protein [Alphaproteobacteria bacterium]